MNYRFAAESDLDLLAEWNRQLIRDEGHRNAMTLAQLRERMAEWLENEYQAVLFYFGAEPLAYALYTERDEHIYLRQLFVSRSRRRQGIGGEAVAILREQIWPAGKRLTVEVLTANKPAIAFWRSAGYNDYALTLEIMPGERDMNASHEGNWDRLNDFVAGLVKEKGIPGVAVGVLHRGGTAAAGFGVTNVDHPLPVTDETLYQIGSITKTFTGTAVMRLVERGEIELEARIRSYLPDFKVADETAASGATVRHLLTHTGGWVGDYFDDTGPGDDALAKYVANMAGLEQLAPLGTVWSYNNSGFCVAGRIVEAVTGKSFEAALRELVLDPLGLENCYFDPGDLMTRRFAVGHNVTDDVAEVALPWPLPRAAYAAGGITCHVHDLLRYARFHLGDGSADDGTRLLSPESMAEMQRPQATIWENRFWGLTWAIDDTHGARQISHGGGTTGQVSRLLLVPERDFAMAIFTNAEQGGHVTREVSKWALKHYLDVEVVEPAPIEASPEEVSSYVGRYSRPFAEIELGILGGRLVGQLTYKRGFPDLDSPPEPSPPPMTLALCGKDYLLVMDGPAKGETAEIVRKADGSVGWLRVSGRLHVRQA